MSGARLMSRHTDRRAPLPIFHHIALNIYVQYTHRYKLCSYRPYRNHFPISYSRYTWNTTTHIPRFVWLSRNKGQGQYKYIHYIRFLSKSHLYYNRIFIQTKCPMRLSISSSGPKKKKPQEKSILWNGVYVRYSTKIFYCGRQSVSGGMDQW